MSYFCFRPLGDDYVYVYLHNDDTSDIATPPLTTVPLRKNDRKTKTNGGEIFVIIMLLKWILY